MDEIVLDQVVDVWEDSITVRLPDMPSLFFTDDDLDGLFYSPEYLYTICDPEQAELWNSLIPDLIRIRERKRDLYDSFS